MNNKGLTLIELMAVIAIIAILAVMIVPGIFSLRTRVLESSYKNKVSQIVTAGRDYGMEHITELKSPVTNIVSSTDELHAGSTDCIYRTVNFLINNGYLKSKDKIIIVGTFPNKEVDYTNFLKIEEIK